MRRFQATRVVAAPWTIALTALVVLHADWRSAPAWGAPPARKPTHLLQLVQLEVAPLNSSSNAWDTGFGAFTRPDPQVTVVRNDPDAQRRAAELLVQAQERRIRELGKPVDTDLRRLLESGAAHQLSCGARIAALQDAALTQARSAFAADTQPASDTILTKLMGGEMPVALGDQLTIYVNDIDLAAHDAMGEQPLPITRELLNKGELELKFGSVESLRLKLIPQKP